jgi:hypothetical protein
MKKKIHPFIIPKRKLRIHFSDNDYARFAKCEEYVKNKLEELTGLRGEFLGYKAGVGKKFGPEDIPTGRDPLDLGFFDNGRLIAIVEVTSHNYSYSQETGDRPCKFVPIISHKIGRKIEGDPPVFVVSIFNRNVDEKCYWATEERIKRYDLLEINTKYGPQENYITDTEIWNKGLETLAVQLLQLAGEDANF